MTQQKVTLERNRVVTSEIFDDGCIGLEFTKEVKTPNYKNGDTDNHEVYYNMTEDEVLDLVDFLIETLAKRREILGIGEMENA